MVVDGTSLGLPVIVLVNDDGIARLFLPVVGGPYLSRHRRPISLVLIERIAQDTLGLIVLRRRVEEGCAAIEGCMDDHVACLLLLTPRGSSACQVLKPTAETSTRYLRVYGRASLATPLSFDDLPCIPITSMGHYPLKVHLSRVLSNQEAKVEFESFCLLE